MPRYCLSCRLPHMFLCIESACMPMLSQSWESRGYFRLRIWAYSMCFLWRSKLIFIILSGHSAGKNLIVDILIEYFHRINIWAEKYANIIIYCLHFEWLWFEFKSYFLLNLLPTNKSVKHKWRTFIQKYILREDNMNNSKARPSVAARATRILPMEVWCDVSEAGAYINCQDSKGKPLEKPQKVESTLGPSRMDKVGDSRHFRRRD